MSKGSILIVLTSHDRLGDSGASTGFHYEEMTTPYYLFKDAGYDCVLASIKGGRPPHDPGSLKEDREENPPSVNRFIADEAAMSKLSHSLPVGDVEAEGFAALYLPGGHGTMWDLPENAALGALISRMLHEKKPVAAVCHGPAGLIAAEDAMGQPVVKGRKVNCFTNREEEMVEKQDIVPFLLETALRELGAEFECSEPFKAHVAQDENLITGQNPASAEGVARAVIRYLQAQGKQAA